MAPWSITPNRDEAVYTDELTHIKTLYAKGDRLSVCIGRSDLLGCRLIVSFTTLRL